jgi:hypothetical protein
MLEFERNQPIETSLLADLFARCGWREEGAELKLQWALAASEDWVVCKLNGELIGFGRSCRLGPAARVMFDVLVDPRFNHTLLRGHIVRLLAQNAGKWEEVSVFTQRQRGRLLAAEGVVDEQGGVYTGGIHIPVAPPGAYLGRRRLTEEEDRHDAT